MRPHTSPLLVGASLALLAVSTLGVPAVAQQHPRPAPPSSSPTVKPTATSKPSPTTKPSTTTNPTPSPTPTTKPTPTRTPTPTPTTGPTPAPTWSTVATGLDNPRLLSFSGGSLYVAESGRGGTGPCATGPEGDRVCLGSTGAITKVVSKRTKVRAHKKSRSTTWLTTVKQKRVVTGLPSLAGPDGGAATGPTDVVVAGRRWTATIGLGGTPEVRAQFGSGGTLLGTLSTGTLGPDRKQHATKQHDRRAGEDGAGATLLADLAGHEAATDPDGNGADSNPAGLAADRKGFVAVDAGGNDLLRIAVTKSSHKSQKTGRAHAKVRTLRGTVSTLAVFPQVNVPSPFPPAEGEPGEVPMDAVPTSAVKGPDGAWYVSQLTGFPFPTNGASIFRVVPGRAPTVYATGLTNVTDLAWHRGKLYAVQLADAGLLNVGEGQLPVGSLRVIGKGTSKVVAEGLPAPYGVALKGDNAYVTTCAVCAGGGSVAKVPLG